MQDPERLLPLTPLSFYILLAVARRQLHGYAILHEVEEASGGAVRPGTGTLYAAIHRLQADGLLEEAEPPEGRVTDARRHYYRITELGSQVAGAEAKRLRNAVGLATSRRLLSAEAPGSSRRGRR